MRAPFLRRTLRTVLAAMVVTLPVMAYDAPLDQYVEFTGDSQTIQDKRTKLEWQRFDTDTPRTFAQAKSQCAAFGAGGRIPTIKELFTLLDEDPHPEYEFGATVEKMIDQRAFGDGTGVQVAYWSSTPVGITAKVWGLRFDNGLMDQLDTGAGTAYVRCVR